MKWLSLVPGIGPLASAGIGAHAGLLSAPAPLEPEIPTAMDDWDRDFELATGALPSFSRLRVRALLTTKAKSATLRFHQERLENAYFTDCRFEEANRIKSEPEPDALAFAGKRHR